MQNRLLPHTDLTVSRVCLGTMTFGAQCDEATARRMLDYSLDQGINFVDSANVYNGGASEETVGEILAGRRERVVLASKVGIKAGECPDQQGLSRRAILRGIDESLRRLRTDYLDIYYLHQPDATVPLEETLETMDCLVRSGKVRYPAVSNFASWQVCGMQWLAGQKGFRPIHIAQPMYNLLARGIEPEFLPMAREMAVSTIVYNPLAGGLLTGKHKGDAPLEGTRFDQSEAYMRRYWHAPNLCAVEKLTVAACAEGRPLVSLALNWVLHHTAADCVIVGASRLEQLEQNLRVLDDGPLSPEALAVCDEIWTEVRGIAPQYNR